MRLFTNIKNQITLLNILYFLVLTITITISYEFIIYLFYFNTTNFFNNVNLLGLSLFITGVWVGLIILFIGDVRTFFNKLFSLIYFLSFLILIYFFISETNYLMIFIYYELFLLPSFYLVYWLSPNRRSIVAAIYFLTWTQTGSLCLLIVILYLYSNVESFELLISLNNQPFYIIILFFLGVGVKVPIWPLYYWLTKTHVEASSFFSIYLSGFLVKTAIYLFSILYPYFNSLVFDSIFLIIICMGVIDSSIKMWHQIDVKKLIAYTTVQEMNILFLPLFWMNETSELLVSLFILTHCLLSTLLFFTVDILIKRFHTRIVTNITGIIQVMPLFGLCMIITLLLFTGLPFTIKFFLEINIFNLLLNFNIELTILIIFIANWIGLLGFSKIWFNLLFGRPQFNGIVYDLTIRELIIYIISFLILIFINYLI